MAVFSRAKTTRCMKLVVSIILLVLPWRYKVASFQLPETAFCDILNPNRSFISSVSVRRHRLHMQDKSVWGVSDDWSSLSSKGSEPSPPARPAPELPFECDLDDAECQDEIAIGELVSEINSSIYPDPSGNNEFVPLYDNGSIIPPSVEEQEASEISFLVRCNEVPEWARPTPPPPTEAEKVDIAQLVDVEEGCNATPFFEEAINKLFSTHAGPVAKKISSQSSEKKKSAYVLAMDAPRVASWMSQSLGLPVTSYDKRVGSTIAKYSSYGTGYLNRLQFRKVYVDAIATIVKKAAAKGTAVDVSEIFRDFRNHGILSIKEQHWKVEVAKWEAAQPFRTEREKMYQKETMVDECEILEWGSGSSKAKEDVQMTRRRKNKNERSGRGSHADIELAKDGKTPLYHKDGDFVFIDEESCIGCTQCALVAPGFYKMLESGRARAFAQGTAASNPEIASAVQVCPVNCMHKVSYDELAEMETAREIGDGRSDHRHFGGQKAHTPLHVARRGTDANHKSSWYHFLKQKCLMSSQCPSRGCYDCPMFSQPGDNPFFQKREKEAERIRLEELTALSDEGIWFRKVAEL